MLIGFDLRRPTLSTSFEVESEFGLSNYLIGQKRIEEVIHQTDFENLYVLPSGPIPPNPGELSSSKKAVDLLEILKEEFDYIIVDSAPIGVVSDIYPIAAISDAVLVMVRHGHTKGNILSSALTEIQENGIHNLSLIVNDVKTRGRSYQYSYKYKFEYENKNRNLKKKA